MAEVKFKRKSTSEIQNLPIDDGSFIVDYESGSAYIDYLTDRIQISGGGDTPSGDAIPVGLEAEYTGSTAPEGWIEVDEKADLLWTNPNPNNSFSQQIITISTLPDYDEFEIFYYDSTNRKAVSSTKFLNGKSVNMMAIFQWSDHGNMGNRNIIWNTDTKLQFNDAVTVIVNDAFSRTANNTLCIPIYIVGYKTGLFN